MPIYFALFLLAAAPSLDWPQWGGPERNFKSGAKGLVRIGCAGWQVRQQIIRPRELVRIRLARGPVEMLRTLDRT